MPRNVEIKARITSIALLEPQVAALANHGPELIAQDDTFFKCAHGRLKLRAFTKDCGELIAYSRLDVEGPKVSDYRITPTDQPDVLRETLLRALGPAGRVKKQRRLYLIGRTRVHLDQVEGLGEFLELEVVLGDGEPEAGGIEEAHALLAHLAVPLAQRVSGAYVDMLGSQEKHP